MPGESSPNSPLGKFKIIDKPHIQVNEFLVGGLNPSEKYYTLLHFIGGAAGQHSDPTTRRLSSA